MRHVAAQQGVSESKPLSEPVLLILLSLMDEPRHGYALIKNIEAMSKGRVRLSTGTLYGALRRLLNDGWIERSEGKDTARDKQTYKLTSAGYKQLQWELERMKHLTQVAEHLVKSEV